MGMTKKKTLGIIGLVVLAIVAGVLIYRDHRTSKIEITGNLPGTVNNTGISMTGDGKVEIVKSEATKLPPAPSLDRAITPLSSLDPALVKNLEDKMAITLSNLKKDSTNQDAWVALGGERKVLGDYEGARDAWEYAKAINPNVVAPWSNLADLYQFYIKDYVKSEQNWKKTFALDVTYIQGYRGLYYLYVYSMPTKTGDIPAMLKAAIAKNPAADDLKVLLADYEKSVAK